MFEIICTKLLVCLDPTITDFTICLPNLTWSYDFFSFIWVLLPFPGDSAAVTFFLGGWCFDDLLKKLQLPQWPPTKGSGWTVDLCFFTLDNHHDIAEGPCDWPFRTLSPAREVFRVFVHVEFPMTVFTLLHDRFLRKWNAPSYGIHAWNTACTFVWMFVVNDLHLSWCLMVNF